MKSRGKLAGAHDKIRAMRPSRSLAEIARVFGVTRGAISLVLRGEWNPSRRKAQ